MTVEKFEEILDRSESEILDFKKANYDFSNDNDRSKTIDFVKDIVCFANTVRTETAYIILGVKEQNGIKTLFGIENVVDEAILQEKVKDKVFPIPKFSFSTIKYQGKIFGIISIPISKYETPITPTKKLKGLEPGKYYTRRGTSNSEANGHECVSIYNWFSSIPSIAKNTYLIEEVNNLMKKISEPQLKLSLCLSESLTLAKKYDLENLKTFCFNELSGYGFMSGIIDNSSEVKFRISTVAVTYLDFQFRQYSTWDSRMVFNELKNHKDVFEVKMFFPDSIYKIEEIIQELSIKPTLCSFKSTARKFLGDSKENDYEVTVYADKDVYDGIYSSIKQRLIDNLINIV